MDDIMAVIKKDAIFQCGGESYNIMQGRKWSICNRYHYITVHHELTNDVDVVKILMYNGAAI